MSQPNFKELILGTVVMVSLLGLLAFAVFDETTRPVFLDVAKLSIGIYMGYLIPNQN
ncbi:hypothetical protein Riv7116_4865 [Rivularia sp. PCC 7116]|uniref:hypothetical protein n=1 Tax=Rivularia sp. PCC 7116 TaxID=373994 RepID=UPI00029EEE6E|nr:hypothetical protein [Rivularia sp. PCC 7116]AFY57276.1 hypothetical protein Riv7116_4865 [Rivularia sp. PCC 7116]